jgi:hypothetical protein
MHHKPNNIRYSALKCVGLERNEGTSHYMDLCGKLQAPTASHPFPRRKIDSAHRTGI